MSSWIKPIFKDSTGEVISHSIDHTVATLMQVETAFVSDEAFDFAMLLLGSTRHTGTAGKHQYTFIGDDARTLFANWH